MGARSRRGRVGRGCFMLPCASPCGTIVLIAAIGFLSFRSATSMSALARFESFMENMVEGSVARLFRSPVQPAEIAKRLERAMEAQQTISVRRVIVPNVYRAFLNPQDLAAFGPIRVEMEREMATYLAELAQERG